MNSLGIYNLMMMFINAPRDNQMQMVDQYYIQAVKDGHIKLCHKCNADMGEKDE